MTVIAFAIGFILAIPAGPIVWLDFIAHGVGLGLVATGLYRTGESLVRK
jgi:hypothetical protein